MSRDPLASLPMLSAEVNVDINRLDTHRLTPRQMVDAATSLSAYSNGGHVGVGSGLLDGLVDIILFLPLNELTALRAEYLPTETK